jgi:predicted CDP-diglyceride synthetase/phosphatidate cytidylyltransferase
VNAAPGTGLAFALFAADAAVRPWRSRDHGARQTAFYLALTYAAIALAALAPAPLVTVAAALTGLAGFTSYARMVGLTQAPRFFVVGGVATLAFYVGAGVHWYGLFQAMPVYAISLVAAAGAVGNDPKAFLQKMCLAWLGLLVFGYLLAHAALFLDTDFHTDLPGGAWLAIALGLAKAGDVARLAALRLAPRSGERGLPWAASPFGGAVAGLCAHAVVPAAMTAPVLAACGAIAGLGVAVAARAYRHILADVVGDAGDRPLKGAMVFTTAFAIALAYHFLRYVS